LQIIILFINIRKPIAFELFILSIPPTLQGIIRF